MKLIKKNINKLIVTILLLINILTMSTNSFAKTIIRTNKLSIGDQLKFTGTMWKVYKNKKIAQSVGKGKRPKAKRYIKKGEKIEILKIEGNVLKISSNEYIYYASNASKYFKKEKQKNETSSGSKSINTEKNIKKHKHVFNSMWKISKIENDLEYHSKIIICPDCKQVIKRETENHDFKLIASKFLDTNLLENKYECKNKDCGAIKVEIVNTKKMEIIDKYLE